MSLTRAEQEEILEAISILEDEYNELDQEACIYLSYTTTGYFGSITMDINEPIHIQIDIWNSENEERIFNEEKNEYETFYKFIKRQVKLASNTLKKFK